MSTIGQKERATQQRVVKLFRKTLGYAYPGNWEERENNRNLEPDLLRTWLKQQGQSDNLINKVLFELEKAAGDTSKSLYDRNRAVYELLRYGVKVKPDVGENNVTVWLVDWKHPEQNDFAVAEEVTVAAADAKAHEKRPDVVIYIHGIALGVLELKRSTVPVAEGIRQNLDNQKKIFIERFFSTIQLVMAGNDTEGLRYGTTETKEKYFLIWKEDSANEIMLDRALLQLCDKALTASLVRAYANLASEVAEAGYTEAQAEAIKKEVTFHENLRNEVKLHNGDAIDLKQYEPAMRHLIDAYIHAEESEKVSAFDDMSLIRLIVARGADAVLALPEGIRKNKEAVAETIENNVRRLIIDESPINPRYYEKMSELLDALIAQRKQEALDYAAYLAKIVELTKQVMDGPSVAAYPKSVDTSAKRALYDNFIKNEAFVAFVVQAVRAAGQDDWRSNPFKVKKVSGAIESAVEMYKKQGVTSAAPITESHGEKGIKPEDEFVDEILELVKNQHEY